MCPEVTSTLSATGDWGPRQLEERGVQGEESEIGETDACASEQ